MTITQRLELHRRGYSKDEINELAQQEKDAAAAPAAPEPAPEPAAPAEVEPAQAAEPAPAAPAQPSELSKVLDALNALTAAMQKQNIQSREQPPVQQETTSDIFNSILKG